MEKLFKFFVIFILFICSCSHFRGSGHYRQMLKGETPRKFAKRVGVKLWKLKIANDDRKFAEGQWLFIPSNVGILYKNRTLASLRNKNLMWPVPSSRRISSKFGYRWGRKHEGIDISARYNSHIVAAESGVVVYAGSQLGSYGKIVVIGHSGGFFTVYAHANSLHVKTGQTVYRGQVIAKIGSTGRSTGPHLHFEVRSQSKAFDPIYFL